MVTAATLGLRQHTNYSGTSQNILARMVNKTTGWQINTSSATWTNLAGAVDSGYDSPTVHPCNTGGSDCTVNLNVSAMVRAWYTRTPANWKPNIGIQVRYDSNVEGNGVDEDAFYRYTNGTGTNRPLLTITYELGGFAIDFDPALGTTYAPSQMVAGVNAVLPITVTNNSGFAFDTTNYRVGYRFFDVKGKNVAGGSGVGTASPAAPHRYSLTAFTIRRTGSSYATPRCVTRRDGLRSRSRSSAGRGPR